MFTKLRRLGEINLPRVVAALVLASLLAASGAAGTDDAPPPPRTVREIKVRLACDEEWRAQAGWEALARGRLAAASDVFEKRFAIRWRAVDVVKWKSDDAATDMQALLEQVERDVPRAGADIVLGFTAQARATGADRDYRLAGLARFFGPAAIVRGLDPEPRAQWNVGALVHELAHVLGAWHSASADSVMWETGERKSYDVFDAPSAAVIELCRDIDFARGADWIDGPRRRRMVDIYRAGHASNSLLSYVDAEMDRAWKLLSKGRDVLAARAAYRDALAEQRTCVPADDPSLVICLRVLAWADIQGPLRDLGEAECFARLAQVLAAANGIAEDPPLQSEFVLADIGWERGRFEEATAAYRQVYAARLDARGASDPGTADIRSVLERRGGLGLPPKRWQEVVCAIESSPAADPESGIETPPAGAVRVRPLPAATVAGAASWADSACAQFGVTTPEAGDLTIELLESGAGARGGPPRTATARVAASGESRVWVTFATAGPKAGADAASYSCEVGVAADGAATPTTSGWFSFDAPWNAAVRRTRVVGVGAAGFLPAKAGTAVPLGGWEWVGVPGQTVVASDAAKCSWRLELTFTPDAAK